MRVLVAMSGGVDSSVAAALLVEQGHDVVGATLKLWGGPSDSGCCSVADVEDARRVAQQLGITHHVFNMTEEFDRNVVAPYVGEHALGRTPNPCIECNRSMKFDRLLHRADRLGFDRLATGHHARVAGPSAADRRRRRRRVWQLRRGADPLKDQSYVLSMLGQDALSRVVFPVGDMTKDEVRAHARRLGLRTAAKPDSQDVCFIGSAEGREGFLSRRVDLHPAEVVDGEGRPAGSVQAVELVTVGQRRGMGHGSDGKRRYVTHVDVAARRVTVGSATEVMRSSVLLAGPSLTWVDRPLAPGARAVAQVSAHGRPVPCTLVADPTGTAHPPSRSYSTTRSARWRRARRWRSTTRSTPTPWWAPASPPDGEHIGRRGPEGGGGPRRRAPAADHPQQRAVPPARCARDPRRRIRPPRGRAPGARGGVSRPGHPRLPDAGRRRRPVGPVPGGAAPGPDDEPRQRVQRGGTAGLGGPAPPPAARSGPRDAGLLLRAQGRRRGHVAHLREGPAGAGRHPGRRRHGRGRDGEHPHRGRRAEGTGQGGRPLSRHHGGPRRDLHARQRVRGHEQAPGRARRAPLRQPAQLGGRRAAPEGPRRHGAAAAALLGLRPRRRAGRHDPQERGHMAGAPRRPRPWPGSRRPASRSAPTPAASWA